MIIHSNAYYQQHYGVDSPHPEVVSLLPRLTDGEILDLGCGTGRHALFLQNQGFPVTAWDNDPQALKVLQQVNEQESLAGIRIQACDLNNWRFNGQYQAILAVDTLMFLTPSSVKQVIADMQAATSRHGYNLIICAMHNEDQASPIDFPFTFNSGELSHYYRRWHIVHYHEQMTTWTPPHSQGEPIPLRFATLLAQKASLKDLT